ncbi:MAG: DNA mismatch repair endonuclease MutL [Planctomycetota bacterium]|nr:DNA mismatch repair endonuclease MutL [Planctomycetota bacterium]
MASITILSEDLVAKIAAGEVVERPASVCKELIENSIDAGARHVRIDVEEGGRRVIRVTDDGQGIGREDLVLACLPHATSKIASIEDLDDVATLGFRGEALSSIGAVSAMRILSRPRGAEEGSEIMVRGGRLDSPRPAAVPVGTVVEVMDLFYNVPARAKFLRRASTEFRAIADMVTAIAVARPGVGIDLRHNDRRVLNLQPVKDAESRIAGLLGPAIRHGLRRVEGSIEGLRLLGFVSSPKESRADRRSQYLTVRGRPIRDKTVLHAVSEAYHTYLMKGRHAIAFIYLEPRAGEVDYNVHPTKAEARFRDPTAMHALIVESIRAVLEGDPERRDLHVPEMKVRSEVSETAPLWGGAKKGDQTSSRPPAEEGDDGSGLDRPLKFLQVHDFFVVQEVEDGIRIIDQHALHERILLNRLRKEIGEGEVLSQGSLVPTTIALSAGEMAIAIDRRKDLRKVGYQLEEFGDREMILRFFPALLDGADHSEVLRGVISLLETKKPKAVKANVLDGILRQMACRGAVKAGTRLRQDEIAAMLAEESRTTGSFACAHGRPTNLNFSLTDLMRQFGR